MTRPSRTSCRRRPRDLQSLDWKPGLRRRVHRPAVALILALILAGLLIGLLARTTSAQSGWELTPYRVQILVAWSADPQMTPRLQTDLLDGLIDRTDALIGASWDVAAVPAPHHLLSALHSLAGDSTIAALPREETENRDLTALLGYLRKLSPGEELTLPPGAAQRIERGRKLFTDSKIGCMTCHQMPLGTDGGRLQTAGQFFQHDVGTTVGEPGEAPPRLTTPMLFGLRRAKGYLHHGGAKTIEEVFTEKFNPKDRHGRTSDLSEADRRALAEYVRYLEPPELDKLILLAISRTPDGYRVTARELDLRTQLLSPPVSHPVWQLQKLRDVAFDATLEAFAPMARIEDVKKDQVLLRLKAAALPPRDRSFSFVRPGDTFRPVVRRDDRDGNILGINAIEWTFLVIEEMDRQRTVSRLFSGFPNPLSSRRRGRTEVLALGVVPSRQPSTLVVRSRDEDKQPLAGYEILSHPPGVRTTVSLGHTDRQGRLEILPAEHPLRVLLIRNGTEILARLPMVPGLQPTVIAPIANDNQRLEVEGFITGLQEELVDVITRRQVLFTRARTRLEKREFDEAENLIAQLRELDDADHFALALNNAEKLPRYLATDPVRKKKIELLFSDTKKLILSHLDSREFEELVEELRAARRAP